jgi:hypothetical protein
MKILVLALLLFLAPAIGVWAAELVKSNGEVLTGTIEDLPANDYIRIRIKDGKLFEIPRNEIRKLNGKEVVAVGGVKPGEVDWQDVPPDDGSRPAKKEFWQKSWYLDLLEVGRAWLSYPSDTSAAMDALRGLPGTSSPPPLSLQFLGFYWPIGAQKKALLGFNVDASADAVFLDGQQWQLNQYIYSVSALYFPLGKIGDGLYLRADAGAAALIMIVPGRGRVEQSQGIGFLTGLGYMMPISDVIRPFVNLNYSLKSIGNGGAYTASGIYQSVGLDLGLLW